MPCRKSKFAIFCALGGEPTESPDRYSAYAGMFAANSFHYEDQAGVRFVFGFRSLGQRLTQRRNGLGPQRATPFDGCLGSREVDSVPFQVQSGQR